MSASTPAAFAPSRLPVGSSASTTRGSVTSARATAARCRSPPESWWGRCVSRSPRPTRSRSRRAAARATPTGARRTMSGIATFSSAENSGSR